ncbi:MAG: recombination protein RecR, partial [Bacteroidia bacterium]
MELHSKLIQDATERFASLPGIGKKSALRFVLNLIKSGPEALQDLSTLLHRLSHEL